MAVLEGSVSQLFVLDLCSQMTRTTSAASLLRGYAKGEPVTIPKPSQFIITAEPR
ncbi:unnamed protein product, partial [Brassica rapa subsp. trilocularis]